MSFLVTRCPACGSTFNSRREILAAAAGKVRCGACLKVFEAGENLLTEAAAEETGEDSVFLGVADKDAVATDRPAPVPVPPQYEQGLATAVTTESPKSPQKPGDSQVPQPASSRRSRRRLPWTVLCVVLVLVQLGQFLWQERGSLSQVPRLRPIFLQACSLLACELPAYTNLNAIRSEEATVSNHPEVANGLLINVEFRNTAVFPQPLPILILSFLSPGNTVMALREFAPREYLLEGLNNANQMGAMTSLQATLEVVNPGPEVVNYALAFRFP